MYIPLIELLQGIHMRDSDRGILSVREMLSYTHAERQYIAGNGQGSQDFGAERSKMYQGDIMGKKLSPSKGITSLSSSFSLLLSLLSHARPSCSSCVIIPFPASALLPGSPPSLFSTATDIPLFGHRSAIIRDCTHSNRQQGYMSRGI